MELTPTQRTLLARMGAFRQHALHDPRQTSARARATFLQRFEREIDPTGNLDPEERARRAAQARRAYFTGLALKSSRARARRQSSVSAAKNSDGARRMGRASGAIE